MRRGYLFVFLGGRGKEKFWAQILYRLSIIKLTRFYKLFSTQTCFFPTKNIGKVFDEGNWIALRLIAPRLNALLPNTGIITYGFASTPLRALSAYFGVAICNTGRGRKPQNQNSIHMLALIDNDKLFTITSYKHCASFAEK